MRASRHRSSRNGCSFTIRAQLVRAVFAHVSRVCPPQTNQVGTVLLNQSQVTAHNRSQLLITDHCLLGEGSGGGLRSISVGAAIDRAPFLPTARTAKK